MKEQVTPSYLERPKQNDPLVIFQAESIVMQKMSKDLKEAEHRFGVCQCPACKGELQKKVDWTAKMIRK
ncbi:MAG TPA: hypothetical protein VH186_06180 [Chloroflexia bacterium]|nr:hypothetical protein [Chloroflexia bacterium]